MTFMFSYVFPSTFERISSSIYGLVYRSKVRVRSTRFHRFLASLLFFLLAAPRFRVIVRFPGFSRGKITKITRVVTK